MKKFGLAMAVLVILSTPLGASAASKIVRVSDNGAIGAGKFVEEAGSAEVIFIGDTHDDSDLHAKQLEIVKALHARNPRLALGVEMFTTDSQKALDDWSAGKLDEKEFAAIYAKNWSFDWRLYRELFLFARDKRIPLIALNVPKPLISKIVRQGSKGLTEADRKDLPPGETWTLNPRQAEYLRLIREKAFANIPPRFPIENFNEAQALRNDNMAYNIVQFLGGSPRSKVVVIAGTWHAIKNGAPESLKKYGSCTYKVVLPDLPEFSWLKPTAQDVDYLIPRAE